MDTEVINLDSIERYNELYGLETRHRQAAVVDLSKAERWLTHFTVHYGVYALFLKQTKCGDLRYGRQTYDYQEGTVTSFAPGQVVEVRMDEGARPAALGLVFHPDLISGTALGREIGRYGFFSYASNEALHLSEEEKGTFRECLRMIGTELERPEDRHSRRLLTNQIELLLDYCLRFYDRQFVTRKEVNMDVLARFEGLLDSYFRSDRPQKEGLPSVRYFADGVHLSPNYFGDLVKKETGRTAQAYIRDKLIMMAKEGLGGGKNVSEVAYGLGFQYPQHFTRLFKQSVGVTPTEWRTAMEGERRQ